jgi:hypothetical protein
MDRKISRKIEEQITRQLISTAAANGWPCIGYDYGSGLKKETDPEELFSMCMNVDEIYLIFESSEGRRAFAWLIYGNGRYMISDYSLPPGFEESVMTPMNEYTENIDKHLFA